MSLPFHKAKALLGTAVRGPFVCLDAAPGEGSAADTATDPARPRWVQIAYEGNFKGHAIGPFDLTREKFAKAIENFHRHPAYRAGAEGAAVEDLSAGKYDVVHWDFHHASEQPPAAGTVPVTGAPAQGWILEMQLRDGPDGKAQLWAYSRFLEPLLGYIREGKYKWCSMTMYMNAIDPVSAAEIGPYISSVAATNDPFLQGMVALAAQRGGAAPVVAGRTLEYLIDSLRYCFGLPETAGLEAIKAEAEKLRGWALRTTDAPTGVDVENLVDRLRGMLNLPLMATPKDIFEQLDMLFAKLTEKANEPPPDSDALGVASSNPDPDAPSSESPGTLPSGQIQKPAATVAANRTAETGGKDTQTNMDPNFIKVLAQRFGLPTDEAAVQKAILAKLDAAETAVSDGAKATANLKQLLGALGVEDVDGAVGKIAEMFKQCAALEEAMPELGALREMKTAAEETAANDEVEKAMQTHRMPETARAALLSMRRSNVEEFRKKYPLPPEQQRALTASFFAAGNTPVSLSTPAGGNPAPLAPPPGPGAGRGVDLSGYGGRNITERARAYLEKNTPAEKWARMSHDERTKAAAVVVKQLKS